MYISIYLCTQIEIKINCGGLVFHQVSDSLIKTTSQSYLTTAASNKQRMSGHVY